MAPRFSQNAVNWGEISPAFYGRQDLPQYRGGCSTLRNMFVSPRGGAVSRPGLKFVGQALEAAGVDSTPPELIPFTVNVSLAYMVEAGDFYFRFIYDSAYVTEDAVTVSTVTNADPGVFATPAAHGFVADDWVAMAGMAGMTKLNGRTFAVATVPTTETFTLKSTLTGDPIDTTDLGSYTVSSGTVAKILTIATPFAIADVHTLKFTQSATEMSICHPLYKPHELVRNGHNDWELVTTSFSTSISPPETVDATPSTTTTETVATRYQYVVTSVDALSGEESIGSVVATVTNSVNIALTLGSNTIEWTSVDGAAYYNLYKAPASYAVNTPAGVQFGYMATSYGLSFVDTNIVPDFTVTPPLHYNPFATSAIEYFTITATGSGYTTTAVAPAQVAISDTSGLGATAIAVVQSDGGVYAIILTAGGEGYLDPVVAIDSSGGGSGATFEATAGTGGLWYGGVTVLTTGSGYVDGVVLQAQWVNTGTGANRSRLDEDVTVAGTGITAAGDFPVPTWSSPTNVQPLATSVSIAVYGGTGIGAEATATVGPSTGTFPSVVAYFEQRRFYANTLNAPDSYWGSQPGAYTNMDRSLPVTDGDAIVGKPWAQQINGIQWMVPMPGGLVILSGAGAWQLNGGSAGTPLTPVSQNAQAQAYNGISPEVAPITINFDILYVQQEGSIVRDLSYNLITNIYTGTDMTVMSNHLFDNFSIRRWAWSEERHKLVWVVRDDGIALTLAYLKEQNVFGWSRHDTQGQFVSVGTISESPVDAPYFMVKRNIAGTWAYYVERMDNRLWQDVESAWCVDAALAYTQETPDAALTVSSATGDSNVTSYIVADGGAGYTAPTGVVVDAAGTGTGAAVDLTVSGGVITAATATAPGSGYGGPVTVRITDATGSGAAISGVVTDYVTVSASAAVFTAGDVGDIIRLGGGKLEVVTFSTSTSITADVLSPITAVVPNDPARTPLPAAPGDWSIATPVTTVSGLDHLEGMSVTGLADGSVIPETVVADGSITLSVAASKIVIGLPFAVQMQTLFLESPQGAGTLQGSRQEPQDVVLRVEASRPPTVGANQPDAAVQPYFATVPWTDMADIPTREATVPAGQPQPLYTGDWFSNIPANWDQNAQIAFEQLDPLPLTILALYPKVKVGDTGG